MDSAQRKDGPPRRSAEEKLRLLNEAAGLADEDLGELLRREGIHSSELEAWRAQFIELMSVAGKSTTSDQRRVRELERELDRKDKALAELAALLALQKKAQAIWGGGAGGTSPTNDD